MKQTVETEDLRNGFVMQAMVGAWEQQCGLLDQYGMQHTRTFANLCNAGVPIDTLASAAAASCAPAAPAA
jgi:legumain